LLMASAARGEPAAAPEALYQSTPGPYAVRTIDDEWHDAARNRDVPVRIYLPRPAGVAGTKARTLGGPHPVIVFSHGLGGSRNNYGYFCNHLASHGYIVIAPTHAGSDTRSLIEYRHRATGGGWLKDSISDAKNLRDRPRDISFVIDQI